MSAQTVPLIKVQKAWVPMRRSLALPVRFYTRAARLKGPWAEQWPQCAPGHLPGPRHCTLWGLGSLPLAHLQPLGMLHLVSSPRWGARTGPWMPRSCCRMGVCCMVRPGLESSGSWQADAAHCCLPQTPSAPVLLKPLSQGRDTHASQQGSAPEQRLSSVTSKRVPVTCSVLLSSVRNRNPQITRCNRSSAESQWKFPKGATGTKAHLHVDGK